MAGKNTNFDMWYKILLFVLVVCLIVSTILSFVPVSKICGETTSSCSVVQHSKYENLFGINNSYLGIIAFFLLILILISQIIKPKKHKEILLFVGIVFAAIIAVYFIFLQLFVIKAICPYCMVIDVSSFVALWVVLARKKL